MYTIIFTFICSILLIQINLSESVKLRAYLSQHGVHGTITFSERNNVITIIPNLETTLEFPNHVWSWQLMEFPVDYTEIENRCSLTKLGKSLVNFDEVYGYLILPDNKTSVLETKDLQITGPQGLFGKSLFLRNVETNSLICASISLIDKQYEKIAIARFRSPIAGNVYFRWLSTKDDQNDMLIITDLYHVRDVEKHNKTVDFTNHIWKIYVTDIFNAKSEKLDDNCNILQLVFNPENQASGNAIGDIDTRLGNIKISTNHNKYQYKTLYRDEALKLLPGDLAGPQRRLYLVVFQAKHEDSFLGCARIQYDDPINAKVLIQSGGIKGDIILKQYNTFEPTFITFNLTTARGDLETKLVYSSSVSEYKIHELPMNTIKSIEEQLNPCLTTKFVYNPTKLDLNYLPPNGMGTQEQYPIGDLSGKLLWRNNETDLVPGSLELRGEFWDIFLPLQGRYSVIHRSFIIYKNTNYPSSEVKSEPWICGALRLYEDNFEYEKQIFTAQVILRYPVVGRILFRQPKEEPWADTSILFEYLVHADGANTNNSAEHRWAIHEFPPGKDFYNWTGRCLSAGNIYNPYKVDFDNKSNIDVCNIEHVGICRLGDLSTRLGMLEIAGKYDDSDNIARKFYSDKFLPLTGLHSIIGKSVVLYDDHGPVARGERLACSIIGGLYRRKAVARDWFPNGDMLTIRGKIEFYQQTEYDNTNVEVDLQGLIRNSGYHIHMTSVEENLAFPCEETTLYNHWNPLNVDPTTSPRNYHGTTDQYEMGDLSGKFGTLDNYAIFKTSYNDTLLPLFGQKNLLGRSIIIHKKELNRRWACSTIERGYSPSEARELRAIASFHHPYGYAYGYIRMTQLVYNDGSMSDTTIEVKLRHPGKNDRNITRDHNWAIYVNPVGVDASVQTQYTRCVAGGYVWNPYYTQLADPLNDELYRQECKPNNPLRCHVGDISSRLGTIDIGLKRFVLSDSNFPLEGQVSAMGRSIVILSPNRKPERFACANIEPDYDIIKYVNIEKPPRFVVAQFIEDIRAVMGIPEWMLTVDSRKTKTLHNDGCVQILLHFKGPIAIKLEQDFGRLISIGLLEAPTLYIPGYINTKRKSKISYKQCGVRDPNEKGRSRNKIWSRSSAPSNLLPTFYFIIVFNIYLLYVL